MDARTSMTVVKVVQMEKGISIRVICDHGAYAYTINDGEPTWFKFTGDENCFVGLNKNNKADAKLITKLNREWKNARYWG